MFGIDLPLLVGIVGAVCIIWLMRITLRYYTVTGHDDYRPYDQESED